MDIKIEVKRRRVSVTQGYADIFVNGEKLVSFGDHIQLIKEGVPFYGEVIGRWASTTSDAEYIRKVLFCKNEYYGLGDRLEPVLKASEEAERRNAVLADVQSRRVDYIMRNGGMGGLREADDVFNDFNREELNAMVGKYGKIFIGKINFNDNSAREALLAGGDPFREYTGEKVYNFGCDYAIPTPDPALSDMIRKWNGPNCGEDAVGVSQIIDRIRDLGGVHFIWL